MSVYTSVTAHELSAFLTQYDVGELHHFEGISAGIENTNYFVDTECNGERLRFVLTLFETYSKEEMPFFLNLMAHVTRSGVPSASPVASISGELLLSLNGKPAALVERLNGHDITQPNEAQIASVGSAMAKMHRANQNYPEHRPNCRGLAWQQQALLRLIPKLSQDDAQLIDTEIKHQLSIDRAALPSGAIHADLFHDNALYNGDELVGIIDFYFACTDAFTYDMAVTINDWCKISTDNGAADESKLRVYLNAYQQQRALTETEKATFVDMLRAAALRFWLSRLFDYHFPRAGEMTHTKDPDEFKRILTDRIERSSYYLSLINERRKP